MSRKLRNAGAWALSAVLASSVHALAPAPPAQARLGDGTVSAARLRPYDNAFVVTFTFSDGTRMSPGLWTDQLRLRTIDGRQVLVRTQGRNYFDGRHLMSVNTVDPTSFAPISTFVMRDDGSRERWLFIGTHVEAHLTPGAAGATETVSNLDLANPAYDFNCCMASLIPAAMRLRVGDTVTLPAVSVRSGDPDSLTYHVLAREHIRAGHRGMVNTWVVQTSPPGGGEIKFWIADSPPFLVRMTLTGLPGSHDSHGAHYDQSFDMLE
jgi:hypothetical protein